MNNIYFEMRRTLCKRKEAPSGLPGAHRLITREWTVYIYNLLYLGDKPYEVEWKT